MRLDPESGEILCRSCEKGKYLDLSDLSCLEKDDSTAPSFKVYVSPDDQNDAS